MCPRSARKTAAWFYATSVFGYSRQEAADLLNRCLSERGRIIGMEKNFNLLNIGEHQVVLQSLVYHIGFSRKPIWLGSSN